MPPKQVLRYKLRAGGCPGRVSTQPRSNKSTILPIPTSFDVLSGYTVYINTGDPLGNAERIISSTGIGPSLTLKQRLHGVSFYAI